MLAKTLWAEILKTRRTLALLLTIIAPAVIVAFVSGFYFLRPDSFRPIAGENSWNPLSQMVLVYWNLLMLPLFITLETALIAQLEHGQKNWKLLFAQPVPRWSVYAAKLIVCCLWIATSYGFVLVFILAAGGILQGLYPNYHLDAPVPWGKLLPLMGLSCLASSFMIAFHLWVASRWQSFVIAMGTGIAASIVTLFLFGEEVANYLPWSIPGVLAFGLPGPATTGIALAICLPGAVVAALLGGWDVLRRDVA
jgi:hypothetical protein